MAFIVTLITDAIIEDLTDALDEVNATELYDYSNLIRLGRLQDDPEAYSNPVMVYENDPADPGGWAHEQYRAFNPRDAWEPNRLLGGEFELGGSELYLRRFTVELKLFLTQRDLTRDQAKVVIDLVHGKCIKALRESVRIKGLKDEFDEIALMCRHGVVRSNMRIKGGPPTDWIGDGKIWLQVLTQLP